MRTGMFSSIFPTYYSSNYRINVQDKQITKILITTVPHNYKLFPLFLLFVNDVPDALEALKLLFAEDVKMFAPRTQNLNIN